MNIAIAAALLIVLLAHIGKKNGETRSAPEKNSPDDLGWIDELEVLDAVMDDFWE